MKIGIFTYNFPHYKSQQGIYKLLLSQFKITAIFAANPVELKFRQSKIRVSPKYTNISNSLDIANSFSINYHVVKHNSKDTIDLVKSYNLDVGIILGARIISQSVIDSFNIGILNMHPGIIPLNRGLDNLKWAILDNLKQGVTTHLISKEIDKGKIIDLQTIEVFEDDTLIDIHIRLQELELKMMIEALENIKFGKELVDVCSDGVYHDALTDSEEEKLIASFDFYKKEYSSL